MWKRLFSYLIIFVKIRMENALETYRFRSDQLSAVGNVEAAGRYFTLYIFCFVI
jgi:hypothetical protein